MKSLIEGGSKLVGKRGQFSTGIFTFSIFINSTIQDLGIKSEALDFLSCDYVLVFKSFKNK